jgi:hypothetical protein
MDFKAIKGCGKVAEYRPGRLAVNTGKKNLLEFLRDTLREIAKVSTRIFDTTGDLPFWYKEKQLSSVLLPCFYNLGYGAIQEIPTRRKPRGKESSHGWLDYWVQKNDNVYLIEVKHGWLCINSQKFGKCNSKEWQTSIKQLNNIKKSDTDILKAEMVGFKISIMLLPIWRNIGSKDEDVTTPPIELEKLLKRAFNTLEQYPADWAGVWSLPNKMQYVFESEGINRVIPGMLMFAKIMQ